MSTDRVICSDFEMPNDEAANAAAQALLSFPSRDCAGEDAQFRKEPTPFGFPCCDSTELRLASLVLKVGASPPQSSPRPLPCPQPGNPAHPRHTPARTCRCARDVNFQKYFLCCR